MTTTGERTFNTEQQQVQKSTFTLIPNGPYTGKLLETMDIGKSKEKYDAAPYVNIQLEAEGTATTEGGKNRKAFHRLLLGLNPGKDGVLNPNRPAGVVALMKALGTSADFPIVEQTVRNPDTGDEKKVEFLDPKAVIEALENFVGSSVKMRIGTSTGDAQYGPKNEVKSFSAPDAA